MSDSTHEHDGELQHDGCIGPDCPICLNPANYPRVWKRQGENMIEQSQKHDTGLRTTRIHEHDGEQATCANCGHHINTGTFNSDGFTIYCGACGYVETLREMGADNATLRSAERAAVRTRFNRDCTCCNDPQPLTAGWDEHVSY